MPHNEQRRSHPFGRAQVSRTLKIAPPALIYAAGVIIPAIFDPADAPDPERVYLNYLKTCEMLGIEPTPRDHALGVIGEWSEVFAGKAPTVH